MISFWIDYGTNFIGGPGETQHEAAWRIPLGLQLVPAIILGTGILLMPHSPRFVLRNRNFVWMTHLDEQVVGKPRP